MLALRTSAVLAASALAFAAATVHAQDERKEIQKYQRMTAANSPVELWELEGADLWKAKRGPIGSGREVQAVPRTQPAHRVVEAAVGTGPGPVARAARGGSRRHHVKLRGAGVQRDGEQRDQKRRVLELVKNNSALDLTRSSAQVWLVGPAAQALVKNTLASSNLLVFQPLELGLAAAGAS